MVRALQFSLISIVFLVISLSTASAGKPPIYTGFASDLAVNGYDPVAFFAKAEPTKGSKAFSIEYKGATWRFESQLNLDLFLESPDAYAPQYGGYCAWATAEGYIAKGNPKYWTIYQEKLYLNYNSKVQNDWLEDVPGFIEKANSNWPEILS